GSARLRALWSCARKRAAHRIHRRNSRRRGATGCVGLTRAAHQNAPASAVFGVALGRGWVFVPVMRLRCRSLGILLGVGVVAASAAEPAATEPAATDPAKPALDNLVKNSPFGSAASPVVPGA